jgi:hypothetical protein
MLVSVFYVRITNLKNMGYSDAGKLLSGWIMAPWRLMKPLVFFLAAGY